jgi:hypothetical protein
MRRALQVILGISLFGAAFSGVLSYRELLGTAAVSCPSPGAPTVLGYPACVYGFFMYLAVAATASLGLRAGSRGRAAPMAPSQPPAARAAAR